MIELIRNGNPYIIEHRCSESEKNWIMSKEEKQESLVEYYLGIYTRCHTSVSPCNKID